MLTVNILESTPKNFTNQVFRGAHTLLRGAKHPPGSPVAHCSVDFKFSVIILNLTADKILKKNNIYIFINGNHFPGVLAKQICRFSSQRRSVKGKKAADMYQ